jgi:hypothetical protein
MLLFFLQPCGIQSEVLQRPTAPTAAMPLDLYSAFTSRAARLLVSLVIPMVDAVAPPSRKERLMTARMRALAASLFSTILGVCANASDSGATSALT